MNLSEFRALLAEFALENPNRPLSDVTVVEFAAWHSARIIARPYSLGLKHSLERMPDETDAELRARHEAALGPEGTCGDYALARGHKPR